MVILDPAIDGANVPLACSRAPKNILTIEQFMRYSADAKWQLVADGHVFQSFINQPIWCQFLVRPNSQKSWHLSIVDPNIEQLDVYFIDRFRQSYQTGSLKPLDERVVLSRNFYFPLPVASNETIRVVIRLQSVFLNAPIKLMTKQQLEQDILHQQLFSSFALGSVLPLVLLLIATYKLNRFYHVHANIWILGFVLVHAVHSSVLQGYGFEHLWPQQPYVNRIASFIAFPIGLLLFWRYMDVLGCRKQAWERLLFNTSFTLVMGFAGLYLIYKSPWILILAMVAMLLCACVLYFRYLAFVIGSNNQRIGWFWLAWMFMVGMTLLQAYGIAKLGIRVDFVMSLNYLSLVILLGWNLLKLFYYNHKQLLHEMEDRIRKEKQLYRFQAQQVKVLEDKVAERTHDLENTLRRLHEKNLQLKKAGYQDPLTEIMNRLAMDAYIDEYWPNIHANKLPFALALVDADFFKNINDNYGHDAGDACLRFLARTLTQMLSDSKVRVARYGGEEFLVAAPYMNANALLPLLDSARSAIENVPVQHLGLRIPITVSIGVADNLATASENFAELFKNTDLALYQAKEQGRNRIVHWQAD